MRSILVLLLLINVSLSTRTEPQKLWTMREDVYKSFNNFTASLSYKYSKINGYHCISDQEIKENQKIFEIPKKYAVSSFDNFPFKSEFFNILKELNTVESSNTINLIILTLRIMQDLRSNLTTNFINFKRNENNTINQYNYKENFESYKNYLRGKPDFLLKYLNTLPMTGSLGQYSWSEEEIDEYKKSGFLQPFRQNLEKIYDEIIQKVKKNVVLSSFTSYWLNEINVNNFLSIYSIVTSRTFRIGLDDFYEGKITKELSESDSYQQNKFLDKKGGSILIPFIDLCNHFHPVENTQTIKENNKEKQHYLSKRLKFDYSNEKINIFALSNYTQGEEFSFTYSSIYSNDFLILNYGFIIRNNPFQEFVFKFEMDDPKKQFYKKLKKINFSENTLRLSPSNKILFVIYLNKNFISRDLSRFINAYIKYERKVRREFTSLSKEDFMLKSKALYYNTIEKNIHLIMEDKDIGRNVTETLKTYNDKIDKLNNIIERNSNSTHDVYEVGNLFYFKTLHEYLKRRLLYNFGFENIKILIGQKHKILNSLTKSMVNEISKLKEKYIK